MRWSWLCDPCRTNIWCSEDTYLNGHSSLANTSIAEDYQSAEMLWLARHLVTSERVHKM